MKNILMIKESAIFHGLMRVSVWMRDHLYLRQLQLKTISKCYIRLEFEQSTRKIRKSLSTIGNLKGF